MLEGVRLSVPTTPAQATAALKLADDVGDRFPLVGAPTNLLGGWWTSRPVSRILFRR